MKTLKTVDLTLAPKSQTDQAIPLITYEQGKNGFVVNEEAITFLKKLKGPIGVVAVAGLYRTGKSYLLNKMLLNRSSGFGVGPTVNPCTKGLWIWNQPIIGQTAEGDPVNILIIDSEGIGALDEDSSHDNTIFALTILLSSCFIYNSTGSIDENALQNLSLVVNLTKNIHIKSNNKQEDFDSVDYSMYFPQFVWVVRDFTLQLIDQNGEQITSKEYLDRALQIQKGFSDSVESKNRIRRLLQTFFKERDCVCLVRPLTSEENLQNLDNLDFQQLRPEFVEQIITLRKRILNRIKIKEINKKPLNGEMFASLVSNYIKAINEGAVPSIENAWSYICKNECLKAVFDASEVYQQIANEIRMHKFPLSLEELTMLNKKAKEAGFLAFKKKAVGEVADEYLKELKKKLKGSFEQLQLENDKESSKACLQFITQEFSGIERKVKNSEYEQFSDFERELKLFMKYFLENAPQATNRSQTLLECMFKTVKDFANSFIRKIRNDLEVQVMMNKELQKKIENEVKDQRENFAKEQNSLLMKIASMEHQKAEIENTNQSFLDKIQNLQQEIQQKEQQLKKENSATKEHYEQVISELDKKMINSTEAQKDTERKIYAIQSENDKEKALLTQKLSYLEKSLDEQISRDKDSNNELKTVKKQFSSQLKEVQGKYDEKIKQLQSQSQQKEEKFIEIENELKMKEQQFEMEKKKWLLAENSYSNQLQDHQQLLQQLQKENKDLKISEEKNQEIIRQETNKSSQVNSQKMQELVENLKYKEDEVKSSKANYEKELAVLTQKLSFSEIQISELKKQLAENKDSHSKILKAFELVNQNANNEAYSKVDSKQLQELKDKHKKELKNLQTEYEMEKRKLTSQIDTLSEKNTELELQLKLQGADWDKNNFNLQEQVETMEQQKSKLQDQLKTLEASKLKSIKETEEKYQQKIKSLETTIEDLKYQSLQELKNHQISNEDSLAQLKNFFEMEKEKFSQKLFEEKKNQEKKQQDLIEEFETKLHDEAQNYEEEIDLLKDELRELQTVIYLQIQLQMTSQDFDQQLALKIQQIDTLEKFMNEAKDSMTSNQQNYTVTIESQMQKHQEEVKEVQEKYDKARIEGIKKDKELINFREKIDNFVQQLQKKEEDYKSLNLDLKENKKQNNEKIEEMNSKYQKLMDEFLEKKIEYSRESALNHQEIEFQQKKIEEIKKNNEELTGRYEEIISNLKAESSKDTHEKLQSLQQEKEELLGKYEKIKKLCKSAELNYNQTLNQLQREQVLATQKIESLEAQKIELEGRSSTDSSSYQAQLYELKISFTNEKKNLQIEIEKYRTLISQLEEEKSSLQSNYERDKALWDEKFKFLEEQKDSAKKELAETIQKFEQSLHLLTSQKQAFSAHSLESAISEKTQELEQQFQEMQMNLSQEKLLLQQQFEDKSKKYEREIKQLNDQLMLLQHGKMESQSQKEKRANQFQDEMKQLQIEMNQLKQDKDTQLQKQQQQFDKEREQLRTKILETEVKLREVETKRTQFMFEREKDLTKWNMEKDQLLHKCSDLQDQLERIERKRETLLRENERLKGESKQSRKNINFGQQQQLFSQTQKQLLSAKKSQLGTSSHSSSRNLQELLSDNQQFETQEEQNSILSNEFRVSNKDQGYQPTMSFLSKFDKFEKKE